MKPTVTWLAVLCLLGASDALAAPTDAASARFSPAELREDFRIARSALAEGHPGFLRFRTRAELDREFDAAEARLDHPMDAWEFYRVLQPAVVALHCGHTSAMLPESLQRALSTTMPLLPLQVRVLDGHAYVYRDLGTANGALAGREITAVNGVPMPRILDALYAAIPHDGDVRTSTPWRLVGWRFAGNLQRLFGFASPFQLELRDAAGAASRATLAGLPIAKLDSLLAVRHPADVAPQRLGELEFLDGGTIARLKIRVFAGAVDDSEKVSMGDFIRQSFDSLHTRGTRGLILDLRENGGGEDALGKLLLSYLATAPFDYYDDLVVNARGFSFARYAGLDSIPERVVEKRADGKYHAIGHPNWGRQQPATPHFAGRVVALVNGGSFSTTCEFLSHARDLKLATFVGEESGGAYVGNTSGFDATLTLPNTRTQLHIPLLRYDLAVKRSPQGAHGIMPDVPVRYAIEEVLAGSDKEMAIALKMLRAK